MRDVAANPRPERPDKKPPKTRSIELLSPVFGKVLATGCDTSSVLTAGVLGADLSTVFLSVAVTA